MQRSGGHRMSRREALGALTAACAAALAPPALALSEAEAQAPEQVGVGEVALSPAVSGWRGEAARYGGGRDVPELLG